MAHIFMNGNELSKPNIGKKVTVTSGHGAWHDVSMKNSYTWTSDSDDLMILNEKVVNNNGVNKLAYLIYDYKQNKILGWLQQEYVQIGGVTSYLSAYWHKDLATSTRWEVA